MTDNRTRIDPRRVRRSQKGIAMSTPKRFIRITATVLSAGALLGATAAPAAAWPMPLSPDQTSFLNAVRGNFPGDDDQVLLAGLQACRQLYTGQSAPDVIRAMAAQYGASPDQAASLVSAARGTMCTQAGG